MGACNINHSLTDVQEKLDSQKPYLPEHLIAGLHESLTVNQSQETINEIFHLLKKYDLATEEKQKERNEKLETYI